MNDKIIDGFIVYVILYECYEPNEQKYVIYIYVYMEWHYYLYLYMAQDRTWIRLIYR